VRLIFFRGDFDSKRYFKLHDSFSVHFHSIEKSFHKLKKIFKPFQFFYADPDKQTQEDKWTSRQADKQTQEGKWTSRQKLTAAAAHAKCSLFGAD
jgi:hypothetical protein